MVPDLKDERDARDAYTVEQAVEIFFLPPWTGCAGVEDRLSQGTHIFHDSLYFVLLLVWYTGMRREEVCKLLVTDVQREGGYWYISIRHSEASRVKNANSVRLIALSDELIRLGFVQYVEAIRAAGHNAVFPELIAEREGTKKGDVFYRIWWIYIAPMLTGLKRGQAMHAAPLIRYRAEGTGGVSRTPRRRSWPCGQLWRGETLFQSRPVEEAEGLGRQGAQGHIIP